MTKQILTSKGAAVELSKHEDLIDWCFLEGYWCNGAELTCTATESAEFQRVSGIDLNADASRIADSSDLTPDVFAAFRRFLRV